MLIDILLKHYNGGPLPEELSQYMRETYLNATPQLEPHRHLLSPSKLKICSKYDRVVLTDYGLFLEVSDKNITHCNLIEGPSWKNAITKSYTDTNREVIIYKQLKDSDYWSFRAGKYYISPHNLHQNQDYAAKQIKEMSKKEQEQVAEIKTGFRKPGDLSARRQKKKSQ